MLSNVKILVALPDGEGSGPWEEFMAEDFCNEDVLGHVFGFKEVAADSGVGASQVAWFPGLVQGTEGVGDVLSELRPGGSAEGIWARKTSPGALRVLSWPSKMTPGKGVFLDAELGGKCRGYSN